MNKLRIESIEPEILIKKYQSKFISNLEHITPNWACGINSNHIFDISLRPENDEFSFFLVEISCILKYLDFREVLVEPLFIGHTLNDQRVARILGRWENNLFTDPPTVAIENFKQSTLCFADGRHRFKTCYHLKQKEIPIALYKEDIEKFNQIVELVPI
ncbi:hypothetical protein [Niastella sp. OAS944]|uniref:hypothetical protein n=1 Tax=Niastella sp. OAS944 TaxID=2664089 RepID=UPI00347AEF27|nr:hypothetical protein [Chitinophagaceae bacterium OAS944]